VGEEVASDPDVLRESQADDHLNRSYESRSRPGVRFRLWVNYSRLGTNLRHSPEVCLPSNGWTKVESECRIIPIERRGEQPLMTTRLVYSKGELFQVIGFGTTSLERDDWSISCGVCRSPAGAATAGRPGARA